MGSFQRAVQLVKWIIAAVLRATGILRWLRRHRARRGQIPVLWLHRVDGDPDARVPMGVPTELFAKLVAEVTRRYRVAPWEDCVSAARRGDPRPHMAITFDDGYLDNAVNAWPILREVGATAIFCLTTEFVAGISPLWWEIVAATHRPEGGSAYPVSGVGEATYGHAAESAIARLKGLPYSALRDEVRELIVTAAARIDPHEVPQAMTFDQARAMLGEGAEFAGHGRAHAILTHCTGAELEGEIDGCRNDLSERLGSGLELFAYPNGSHDDRIVDRVRGAGFTYAFTTEKGYYSLRSDPFRIPRIGVSEPKYSLTGRDFSWTLFEAELLGVFDVLLLRNLRFGRSGG